MDWRLWNAFLRAILYRMEWGMAPSQQAIVDLLDWNGGCRDCHDIFYNEVCSGDRNTVPYCEYHRLNREWDDELDCPDCKAVELDRKRMRINTASDWFDHLRVIHPRELNRAFAEWKRERGYDK